MSSFEFSYYNLHKGLVLRLKSDTTHIGTITRHVSNIWEPLYEIKILPTNVKVLFYLSEIQNYWEYCPTLQVLYGK